MDAADLNTLFRHFNSINTDWCGLLQKKKRATLL